MSKISAEDLDFDDITSEGNAEIPTAQEIRAKMRSKKPAPKLETKDTHNLAIRVSFDRLKLISVETCTPTEFFDCMSQLYPYMGESDPNVIYGSVQARIRALKNVVSFHHDAFRALRNLGKLLGNQTGKQEKKQPS